MKKVLSILAIFVLVISGYFYIFNLNSSGDSDKFQIIKNSSDQLVLKPTKITIERINVNAEIEHVGLDSNKFMDVPKEAKNVAWYNLGPKPGEKGSAVIAGHLDDPNGNPAVFWNLKELKNGDSIIITDDSGKQYTFSVIRTETYPFDQFPLKVVFANTSGKKLNLITCEGNFDESNKNYSHRTVVFTQLTN